MDSKFKYFVINLLRKGTYRWGPRSEAFKRARIERGLYKCELCGELRKNKDIVADHKEPVVPVTGFTNFDDYIKRMFCSTEGFNIICKNTCHIEKTARENAERKIYRKKALTKKKKSYTNRVYGTKNKRHSKKLV